MKDNDTVAPGIEDSVSPIEDLDSAQDIEGTEQSDEQGNGEGVDYKAAYEELQKNFKGLQGTVQKLIEDRRGDEDAGIKSEFEKAQRDFTAELDGMTESEAVYARKAFEAEWRLKFIQHEQQKEAPVRQELAKDKVVRELQKQYPGLSEKFLQGIVRKYNHPLAVAAAAEAAHATRVQLGRPKPGPVEDSRRGSRSGGDEAELQQLANSGDWDAYWKIVDRQGSRR